MNKDETIEQRTYRLLQIANKNDKGEAIDSDFDGEIFQSILENSIFKLHCKMIELAIAEEREASGWQPIETAPRDGTKILLGRNRTEEHAAESTLGYWIKEEQDGLDYMGNDAGFVDLFYQTFRPGRSFGNVKYQYAAYTPTHWMPLPNAPK